MEKGFRFKRVGGYQEVYYNGKEIGFKPNNGGMYLQRCPMCRMEPNPINRFLGKCTNCGWSVEENWRNHEQEKRIDRQPATCC